MKILYVVAHPQSQSLNQRLFDEAVDFLTQQGHEVKTSNLYQMGFNPVASFSDFGDAPEPLDTQYFMAQVQARQHGTLAADIVEEQAKVSWSEHIIFQFPLWWFGAPAMLKGWFDRVFSKGFAYDSGKVFEHGLLVGKTASLTTTTQSSEDTFSKTGIHLPIDDVLYPIHHTLNFVGITTKPTFVSYAAFQLTPSDVQQIIADYQSHMSTLT